MSVIERLLAELPQFETPSADDDGARAVLRYLFLHASAPTTEVPWQEALLSCPSCGADCSSTASPYCGSECREIASFARQMRRDLTNEWILDLERQINLGQVLWKLLGGGYPRRIAMIPDKQQAKIFARDSYKCQICGARATALDHIATACNRPINIRSVCSACSTTKLFSDPNHLNETLLIHLAQRISAPTAIRICDDPDTWDWRQFLKKRKAELTR